MSRPDTLAQPDTLVRPGVLVQPDTLIQRRGWMHPLVTVGSTREDRLRIDHLLGRAPTSGYMIRSASSLTPGVAGDPGRVRWEIIAPEVHLAWTSAIPFSLNDGALWAGRGASTQFSGGFRAQYKGVSLTLAPQAIYVQNREFRTLPPALRQPHPGRSRFSSPWYTDTAAIDLPFRFGADSYVILDPGQSSLVFSAGKLSAGAATENQWWGPGIRNAIVMSNNAPGIPHLFVRTGTPLRTRIGDLEAKWMVGGLSESRFFDTIPANDLRSISGVVASLRPGWEPNLTVGVSRVVYAPAGGIADVLGSSADAFIRWERGPAIGDSVRTATTEQLLSLFGWWVFPLDGIEVYAEWARWELPASFTDLLASPNHTQGYTVGSQWAKPLASNAFRVQAELTYLEQSPTFKQRPVGSYYTSRVIPQGYTHRGQVIGASIGPGSSSQWIAADYLAQAWQVGLFLGRIRWQTDAFYTSRSPVPIRSVRSFHAHDVSLLGGIRGGYSFSAFRADAEFVLEERYNYLFQNPDRGFGSAGAVDVTNPSLRLVLSPAVPRGFGLRR